jgi:hypothetical protein
MLRLFRQAEPGARTVVLIAIATAVRDEISR